MKSKLGFTLFSGALGGVNAESVRGQFTLVFPPRDLYTRGGFRTSSISARELLALAKGSQESLLQEERSPTALVGFGHCGWMAEVAGRGGHLLSWRGFVRENSEDVFKDLRENKPRFSYCRMEPRGFFLRLAQGFRIRCG